MSKLLSLSRLFHTTKRSSNSLFGNLTARPSEPIDSSPISDPDAVITPQNDTALQEYHRNEALQRQLRADKYIHPMKKALFDANVAKNGFFKNNQVVEHEGKKFRLQLTPDEIDILEPSVYLRSFRIKSSLKKATQVNRFVRGFNVKTAINQLHFSPKKMATELERLLKKGLEQARAQGMNEDHLYIQALWVGSDGNWQKRADIKGRGRTGILEHPYVHLRAILRGDQTTKRKEWERAEKARLAKPLVGLNAEPLNFKVRPLYKW